MQCQCRGAPAAVLVSLLLAVALCQAAAEYSQLWGRNGERWRRNSRIVDQSYAGYGGGSPPVRAEGDVPPGFWDPRPHPTWPLCPPNGDATLTCLPARKVASFSLCMLCQL